MKRVIYNSRVFFIINMEPRTTSRGLPAGHALGHLLTSNHPRSWDWVPLQVVQWPLEHLSFVLIVPGRGANKTLLSFSLLLHHPEEGGLHQEVGLYIAPVRSLLWQERRRSGAVVPLALPVYRGVFGSRSCFFPLLYSSGKECFIAREDFLFYPTLNWDVLFKMRGNVFA